MGNTQAGDKQQKTGKSPSKSKNFIKNLNRKSPGRDSKKHGRKKSSTRRDVGRPDKSADSDNAADGSDNDTADSACRGLSGSELTVHRSPTPERPASAADSVFAPLAVELNQCYYSSDEPTLTTPNSDMPQTSETEKDIETSPVKSVNDDRYDDVMGSLASKNAGDYGNEFRDNRLKASSGTTSFTLSKHRKVELAPAAVRGLKLLDTVSTEKERRHLSLSDAPLTDSNVLRKVASLTLDKATEQKVLKTKFVPEKLNFQLYEKFEGQMLLNSFVSSISDNNYLKNLVGVQDLKNLCCQFCNHLLAVDVLRQISDKDAPNENVFKPNLMYYWSHMEVPMSQPVTPGRLQMSKWPPDRDTHHLLMQDNICNLDNKFYTQNNNQETNDINEARTTITKLKKRIEELEYMLERHKLTAQIETLNQNLEGFNTQNSLRHEPKSVSIETQTNDLDKAPIRPVIKETERDPQLRTNDVDINKLDLSIQHNEDVSQSELRIRSDNIENYCKLNKSRDNNKLQKDNGDNMKNSNDIENRSLTRTNQTCNESEVISGSSSDLSFKSSLMSNDLLSESDSVDRITQKLTSFDTTTTQLLFMSSQIPNENVFRSPKDIASDDEKHALKGVSECSVEDHICLDSQNGSSTLSGNEILQPSTPVEDDYAIIVNNDPSPSTPCTKASLTQAANTSSSPTSLEIKITLQESSCNNLDTVNQKESRDAFSPSSLEMLSQIPGISSSLSPQATPSRPVIPAADSEPELEEQALLQPKFVPPPAPPMPDIDPISPIVPSPPPPMTGIGPPPPPMPGMGPPPPPMPGMGPPPPPMPGMGPPPPPMPGMGPPPPPMPGMGPPPPPMPGMGPPPPPMPGMGPPPPPMPGMGPPPPPMPGMGPPPPPMPGMGPPPPPMPGMGPPPPPMPGMGPPPPPMPGMGPPPPPMPGMGPPPPPMPGMGPPPPPPLADAGSSAGPTPSVGPMPLPAPPAGFWNQQRATLRKTPVKPVAPMKPLYWTRILAPVAEQAAPQTTSTELKPLWLEIEEDPLDNIEEFVDLFSRPVVKAPVKKKVEVKQKIQAVKILDSKRSQNVGILAQSLHVEFSEIENAIYNFDTSVVSLEALQQIYELRATDEELSAIREHVRAQPDAPLDKPEAFLCDLAAIPNFADRISCFMFQAEFEDAISTIMHNLDNLKHTCEFLMTNENLKKVFAIILTLGNYMNGGNGQRGQADGFGLEILAKLKDVKSKQSQTTLLHYVVRRYRARGGGVLSALPVPQPGDVTRAMHTDLGQLAATLAALAAQLDACKEKTRKILASDAAGSTELSAEARKRTDVFRDKMTAFLDAADQKISSEKENLEECNSKFVATVRFYQYRPKCGRVEECEPAEWFALWTTFCSDFRDIFNKEHQNDIKERLKEAKKQQGERKSVTQPKKEGGLKARLQKLSSTRK